MWFSPWSLTQAFLLLCSSSSVHLCFGYCWWIKVLGRNGEQDRYHKLNTNTQMVFNCSPPECHERNARGQRGGDLICSGGERQSVRQGLFWEEMLKGWVQLVQVKRPLCSRPKKLLVKHRAAYLSLYSCTLVWFPSVYPQMRRYVLGHKPVILWDWKKD